MLQVGPQPVRAAPLVLGPYEAVDRAVGGLDEVAQEEGAEEPGGAGQKRPGGRAGGLAGGGGHRGRSGPARARDVRRQADLGCEVRCAGALMVLLTRLAVQETGDSLDGGRREQGAQGGAATAAFSDPLGQGHDEQGVAAEGEEVVRDADLGYAECLREGLAGAFASGARGPASGRYGLVGCGQGTPVGLAVGGDRQDVEPHVGGGEHVSGQGGGEVRAHLAVGRARRPVRGHGVGDQAPVAGPVLTDDGTGRGDARQGGESGLDLTQLDAEAAQFDLVVDPGDVDELPVGTPAHQVTGAVHAAPDRSKGSATKRDAVRAARPWYPRATPSPETYSSPMTPGATGASRSSRTWTRVPLTGTPMDTVRSGASGPSACWKVLMVAQTVVSVGP